MAEVTKTQIQRLCPDENTRVYFSRQELTETNEQAGRGQEEPVTNGLLALVLEIRGIAVAAITPYSLMLVKAPPFDWTEIEPSVLRLMTSFQLPIPDLEEGL